MDPVELRRRNVVLDGDPMLSTHPTPEEDVLYGSYGLDQCLDLAAGALERGRARDVAAYGARPDRSEEHTSELQSRENLVCRLPLEKKKKAKNNSSVRR